MPKNKLSKTELEIMEYFWSVDDEINASDLHNHFSDKNWSKQTLSTFLKRLVNHGYLKIRKESVVKYYYSPLISKKEYELLPAKNVLKNVYRGSFNDFFCAIIPDNINQNEIDRLKKILDDFTKRIEGDDSK